MWAMIPQCLKGYLNTVDLVQVDPWVRTQPIIHGNEQNKQNIDNECVYNRGSCKIESRFM